MPAEYTALQTAQNRWPVLVTDSTPGMRKIALDRPVCVVGARSRVHLPLPSQLVSKSHALMIRESDGVYLRDLASRNKTFVNNRAIRETRLNDGDVIRFGPFSFRCHRGFSMTADERPREAGQLRVESDRGSSKIIELAKPTFLIGSRYSCDLMLTGEEISLAHAIIFSREGKRYVRDLTSLSGTAVNDQFIREAELKAGDVIHIGASRIRYNWSETTSQTPSATSDGDLGIGSGIPTGDLTVFAEDATAEPQPVGDGPGDELRLPWEKSPPLVFEMKREKQEE